MLTLSQGLSSASCPANDKVHSKIGGIMARAADPHCQRDLPYRMMPCSVYQLGGRGPGGANHCPGTGWASIQRAGGAQLQCAAGAAEGFFLSFCDLSGISAREFCWQAQPGLSLFLVDVLLSCSLGVAEGQPHPFITRSWALQRREEQGRFVPRISQDLTEPPSCFLYHQIRDKWVQA